MKILKELLLGIIINAIFWGFAVGSLWLCANHIKIVIMLFVITMYFMGKEFVRDVLDQ